MAYGADSYLFNGNIGAIIWQRGPGVGYTNPTFDSSSYLIYFGDGAGGVALMPLQGPKYGRLLYLGPISYLIIGEGSAGQ